MKDKIINYIEYLENTHNLSVSMHFADIYKYSLQNAASGLAKYNVHKNPYCFYIKMDKAMHRRCILCQYAVMRKCRKNEFFTGSCHAGVDEYIERIMVKGEVAGYVCASGNRSKSFCRTEDKYLSLSDEPIPVGLLNTVIPPLCAMLSCAGILRSSCRAGM